MKALVYCYARFPCFINLEIIWDVILTAARLSTKQGILIAT